MAQIPQNIDCFVLFMADIYKLPASVLDENTTIKLLSVLRVY